MFDADSGDDEEDDDEGDEVDFAEALEAALIGLGYDADNDARRELAKMLRDATDGSAPFPEDIRATVARKTGASAEQVDEALKRQAKSALVAVEAAIAWSSKREEQLEELDDDEKEEVCHTPAVLCDAHHVARRIFTPSDAMQRRHCACAPRSD